MGNSARLKKYYTKDEIITMYLNRFDWVNNAVGIKSASRVYFNKKPAELKLEDLATLVGMLKKIQHFITQIDTFKLH